MLPSSCFIQDANENPLPPRTGISTADVFTKEFVNRKAPLALPGLPKVVITPGPSVPSVAIAIGGGEDDENGQVLLQTVEMQFGAKDAAASAVYLQ